MSAILAGAKLPKMEKQKEEGRRLAAEKRSFTPNTGRPGKICGK